MISGFIDIYPVRVKLARQLQGATVVSRTQLWLASGWGTKSSAQLIGELDALLQRGWRQEVFVVDDNFIGNHKADVELARELERCQRRNRYPFRFLTEASIDLASRPELLDAMVKANFCRVFIGIEAPSAESLTPSAAWTGNRRS